MTWTPYKPKQKQKLSKTPIVFVHSRFPKGFDIYKEPFEGYTHPPHFLLQEDPTQYGVKNSCPEITWNLYGFPMPDVSFAFEGKEIQMGERYSFNYSRNGVVSLQVNKMHDFFVQFAI